MHKLVNSDRDFAISLVNQLLGKFEEHGIEVEKSEEQEAFRSVMRHMNQYVKTYNVFIESIDIYKVVSWFAFELHKVIKHRCESADWVIIITAHIMNKLLEVDTDNNYKHIEKFVTKICLMALNDKFIADSDNYDHLAIGQNGFYLSFKSPSMMYLKQDSVLKNLA